MEQQVKFYKDIKSQLSEFGPGMCLAKWSQTTIHLGTGHTHSCHHPGTHKIPLEEIAEDPSTLHNTSYKKELRRQMMTGTRPSECHFCWGVEDAISDENVFSDRIYKSSEAWSYEIFDKIKSASWKENINPKYLEISFNNTCNLKCSYCSPEVSSKWMEEILEHGPYPTRYKFNTLKPNKMPILEREENPYVDAFWKWWPSLYPELHTFRITGGEPLLTKHTFAVLDHIIENPNPKLELAINSNLCVPDNLFNKFIEKIKFIIDNKMIKNICLYTSCEAKDFKAEYIRHGLEYSKWIDNLKRFSKECPAASISIMSTYNALSVTSYKEFLEDILEVKKYRNSVGSHASSLNIDIPHLENPPHQHINILTSDFLKYIEQQILFLEQNSSKNFKYGFGDREVKKLKRIYFLLESFFNSDKINSSNQRDFAIFVDEHDKRRGTNFLKTFPEMTEFYNYCKTL